MQNPRQNSITRLTDSGYLDAIVDFHIMAFKNVLSGQIGKLFLKKYYKSILDGGVIYVCLDNKNKLIGFISGIIDESRLITTGYYFYSILGMLTHFYSPALLMCILRHVKRLRSFKEVEIKSELLSVVVADNMRGQGIGQNLVVELEKYFIENQVKNYKVYTDTKYSTGYKLYEKLGFTLYKEVDLYSLSFRMYIKKLIA